MYILMDAIIEYAYLKKNCPVGMDSDHQHDQQLNVCPCLHTEPLSKMYMHLYSQNVF